MVLRKTLEYGFSGCQFSHNTLGPRWVKGKRSVRKKKTDNVTSAIDLLADVARKLLLEGEASLSSSKTTGMPDPCNLNIKEECLNMELKNEDFDTGSCTEGAIGSTAISHVQVGEVGNPLLTPSIVKADTSGLEDVMDAKSLPLISSNSNVKMPLCKDTTLCNSYSPSCWENKVDVSRDDDENSSGCTQPSLTNNVALKPQCMKVAPTIAEGGEVYNPDVKRSYYRRKACYAQQRARRNVTRRNFYHQRRSISTSLGRIRNSVNRMSSSIRNHASSYQPKDCPVKLSIKSFMVPEFFIEIPENSTVASLKRTVMEAVTAILGDGLHIGVRVQGKNVKDDNKTLLQAGISHNDKLDDINFSFEPTVKQAAVLLSGPQEHRLPPVDVAKPLSRFSAAGSARDSLKFDVGTKSSLTPIGNSQESDHDSFHLSSSTISHDNTIAPPIGTSPKSYETLPTSPFHIIRRELSQRRIRRPFSVSEVEALVQAVEKLGTGRWRDVKVRAFNNAKHRTYVDLKDKWKTLVHTAGISPQQRRGAPVPQQLLDRVLAADAYWLHR